MNKSQRVAGCFEISDPQKDLLGRGPMSQPWYLNLGFDRGA
jgi:hypothetical protein